MLIQRKKSTAYISTSHVCTILFGYKHGFHLDHLHRRWLFCLRLWLRFPMLCFCWCSPEDSGAWNWRGDLFRSASCKSCECWLPQTDSDNEAVGGGGYISTPCHLHVPLKVWQMSDYALRLLAANSAIGSSYFLKACNQWKPTHFISCHLYLMYFNALGFCRLIKLLFCFLN